MVDRDDLQMFEMGFELYDYGEWVDSIGLSSPYVPKIRSILDEAVVYKEHSDYSSVNDYTAMPEIPIKDGAFSGLSTYVPPEALQLVQSGYDMLMMRFFTSLKWYRAAGFWRVPLYNIFEQDAEEWANPRRISGGDFQCFAQICGLSAKLVVSLFPITKNIIFIRLLFMAYNLLKGKRGIIFGALNDASIAW